jgi:DNA-binding CsgD family transcriptional regulator
MLTVVDLEQRVRQLAAEGGDLTSVRTSLDRLLRSSVAHDVAAISTVDPATMLWTSCFVSGLAPGGERQREKVIFDLEFSGADLNGYAVLANTDQLVGRLHATTGGDLSRAKRWDLLLSQLGCTDEMRVVLRARDLCWGTLTLYRTGDHPPFGDRDEATIRGAVTAIADLFRLTLLRAALVAPGGLDQPPGLLLVSPAGDVASTSDAAQAWLDAIDDRGRVPSAVRAVAAAAAHGDGLARAALPARDGRWIVLHGSPVSAGATTVAVIVEGARPIVVSEVIAGAYGLTPRERQIIGLAAQGRSTKQMASGLGISPFTVQDHLKAVFAKTGVQSRGELVATLYVQQYEPRGDAGCRPGPYGWYLDDEIPAAG